MKKILVLLLLAATVTSCTFHSSARRWNGLVGANGKPVYVHSSTEVGLNLFVILPLFGNTEIDSMIDSMTAKIAEEDGNIVRVIESATENYWYGFPPFTWIITPVVTRVAADYEPTPAQLAADRAAREAEAD